jgi:hypothetical protein
MLCVLKYVYEKKTIHVERAIAGDTSKTHANADVIITPFENFYNNNKKVKLKDYIVRWADGICMIPKNINDKDIIFIKALNSNDEKLKKIKVGDVLYIEYKNDNNELVPKIREFASFNDDKSAANTFYYLSNSQKKDSKYPHKIDDIKGIVEMAFSR